jgi:hypothetical protein
MVSLHVGGMTAIANLRLTIKSLKSSGNVQPNLFQKAKKNQNSGNINNNSNNNVDDKGDTYLDLADDMISKRKTRTD